MTLCIKNEYLSWGGGLTRKNSALALAALEGSFLHSVDLWAELGTRSNKAARMLGDARHLRRETRPQCWLDNASAF